MFPPASPPRALNSEAEAPLLPGRPRAGPVPAAFLSFLSGTRANQSRWWPGRGRGQAGDTVLGIGVWPAALAGASLMVQASSWLLGLCPFPRPPGQGLGTQSP